MHELTAHLRDLSVRLADGSDPMLAAADVADEVNNALAEGLSVSVAWQALQSRVFLKNMERYLADHPAEAQPFKWWLSQVETGSRRIAKTSNRSSREFARGWYAAVAVLLREGGTVTSEVRSLFIQGGSLQLADEEDQNLFASYNLTK